MRLIDKMPINVKQRLDAAEIDRALTDLARVIGETAVESRRSEEYAPVLGFLVKARRALRESFDT